MCTSNTSERGDQAEAEVLYYGLPTGAIHKVDLKTYR